MGSKNYNRNVKYYRFQEHNVISKINGEVKKFDAIEGKLTDAKITDEEFEGHPYKQLALNIYDGEENSILTMRIGSGYCNAFCKILPNIDLTETFEISAGTNVNKEGKKISSVFVKQFGKSVKWYFTKENNNGLPQPVKIKNYYGKEIWDFNDQINFFIDLLTELQLVLECAPEDLINQLPRRILKNKYHGVGLISAKNKLDDGIQSDAKSFKPIDDLPF
jgi:hypothetical protein